MINGAMSGDLATRRAAGPPSHQATLCFLVRDNEILLAMKKRGFATGKWNGAGGKPEPGETIEAAARRETEEEIGVTPVDLRHMATLDFYFPASLADWEQQVTVFLIDRWQGKPGESDEMAPRWFQRDRLPLDAMWDDDRFWLPLVLSGETLRGFFLYRDAERVGAWEIVRNC